MVSSRRCKWLTSSQQKVTVELLSTLQRETTRPFRRPKGQREHASRSISNLPSYHIPPSPRQPPTSPRNTLTQPPIPLQSIRRPIGHQPRQPQIPPSRFPRFLRCALDPEGRVLVRHDVVFVVRVDGLVLRRDRDFLGGEFDAVEVFEEVGVVGGVEVDVGEGGVAGLEGGEEDG